MAAGIRDVRVRFGGDSSGLARAARDGEQSVGRFSQKTQKFASAALVGVAGIGAGIAAGLKGGIDGLREGEEAEAAFADAVSRSTKPIRDASEAIKANAEAIQARTKFSYEDALGASTLLAAQDGLRAAVSAGTTTIEEATNVSLDLATVLKTDAAGGAKFLAKAMNAPEKAAAALRKAGITLTQAEQDKLKAWGKSGNVAAAQGLVMDKLKAKTEGAANAAGQTTEGQLVRSQAAWGEVQETLAVQVMPAVTKLMGWLVKVTTWAQENPGVVKAVVVVLGALAVVVGAVSAAVKLWTAVQTAANAVTKAWTFAQTKLNVALLANPIGLIVLAVAGFIAAFVLAYKKSETFRNIVNGALHAVKRVIVGVWTWIRDNFGKIFDFITAPYQLAWAVVRGVFSKIRSGATTAYTWVKGKFDALVDFVTGLPGRISSAASGMWNGIKDAFRGAINFIIGGWNAIEFKIPGFKIGPVGYDGFTLGLPDIPMLAGGGTARGGRVHIVGEAGPELFIPGRTGTVVPNHDLGGGDIEVRVFIGERELTDIVDVQMSRRNRATRAAVTAGARRAFA